MEGRRSQCTCQPTGEYITQQQNLTARRTVIHMGDSCLARLIFRKPHSTVIHAIKGKLAVTTYELQNPRIGMSTSFRFAVASIRRTCAAFSADWNSAIGSGVQVKLSEDASPCPPSANKHNSLCAISTASGNKALKVSARK